MGRKLQDTFDYLKNSSSHTPVVSTIVIFHTYLPMKMEQTECYETSAYKIQDAGELPRRKHTKRSQEIQPLMYITHFEAFLNMLLRICLLHSWNFFVSAKKQTSDVGTTPVPDYWNIQIIGCQIKGILVHLYSLWSKFEVSNTLMSC